MARASPAELDRRLRAEQGAWRRAVPLELGQGRLHRGRQRSQTRRRRSGRSQEIAARTGADGAIPVVADLNAADDRDRLDRAVPQVDILVSINGGPPSMASSAPSTTTR